MKKLLGVSALALIAGLGTVGAAQTSPQCGAASLTSTDIAALQADADCYGNQAASDNSQVSDNRAQIATNQGQLAQDQATASANQTQIAALQKQIDALNAANAALATNDAALNSAISSIANAINSLLADAANAAAAQKARLDRIAYLKSIQITLPPLKASDTIFGLPNIPSEFTPGIGMGLQKSWGTGAIPVSAAPDVVGAFRFICGPGQVLADDPIMYPGQPGKSHLHQFYGNEGANAYSTYDSLRRDTGPNSCQGGAAHVLNRSAYWMPALLDGAGNVVRPDLVVIYYKRRPVSDPLVSDPTNPKFMGFAVPLPNGLRFIFGRDMTNLSAPPTGNFHFICQTPGGGLVINGGTSMDKALNGCPVGDMFAAIGDAPDCWDGKNLDSADHRSHVAYASYKYSWTGALKCPPGYPFVIPSFTIGSRYTIRAGDDTGKWTFSSDAMAPGQPRGSTFHADWFGAWDNKALTMWTVEGCVDKLLNCSGGDLGNGFQLQGASNPGPLTNRLIPIASIPKTPPQ